MQDQIIGLEDTVEQELLQNRCKVTICKIMAHRPPEDIPAPCPGSRVALSSAPQPWVAPQPHSISSPATAFLRSTRRPTLHLACVLRLLLRLGHPRPCLKTP